MRKATFSPPAEFCELCAENLHRFHSLVEGCQAGLENVQAVKNNTSAHHEQNDLQVNILGKTSG